MSVETITKEIQGHTYELTLFGAKQGQRVWLRLAKCLGPAALELLDKGSEGMGPAVSAFLSGIGEDDLDYLTAAFAGNCKLIMMYDSKAGKQPNAMPLAGLYDRHFAQRYPALFAWLAWAIKENYASFFDAGGLLGALSEVIPKASALLSPTVLTGSSNESSQAGDTQSEGKN